MTASAQVYQCANCDSTTGITPAGVLVAYAVNGITPYAATFALRGYDSIQLAAAFETGRISGLPICFASFDTRLNKAAKLLLMGCL